MSSLAPVANDVHAADHLADGEEANDLSGGNTDESNLLGVGVANAGQETLGRGHAEVLDGGGVAEDVDQGLEVGLEGGQGTARNRQDVRSGTGVESCGIVRCDLRRRHFLATEHQLAELETNTGVVDGRGDHSYRKNQSQS